jgi:ribonuclease HI
MIWTDSLSSIQAVSALSIRSKTTKDCYDALNILGISNTVELRWIAAHTGLWGNEKADELAKLVTTSDSMSPSSNASYLNVISKNKSTTKFPNSFKNNGKRMDLSRQR